MPEPAVVALQGALDLAAAPAMCRAIVETDSAVDRLMTLTGTRELVSVTDRPQAQARAGAD